MGKGLCVWVSHAKFTSKGKGTPDQDCWCYTVYEPSSTMCLLMLPRCRCKCECEAKASNDHEVGNRWLMFQGPSRDHLCVCMGVWSMGSDGRVWGLGKLKSEIPPFFAIRCTLQHPTAVGASGMPVHACLWPSDRKAWPENPCKLEGSYTTH